MIDQLTIFTNGGIVIWGKKMKEIPSQVLNSFASDVLIDNSSNSSGVVYQKSNFTVKHSVSNDLGLVFTAAYQTFLHLNYVEELLNDIKKIFVSLFADEIKQIKATSGDVITHELNFEKFDAMVNVRMAELEPKETSSRSIGEESMPSEADSVQGHGETTSGTNSVVAPEQQSPGEKISSTAKKPARRGGGKKKEKAEKEETTKGKKQKRIWTQDGLADEDSGNVVLDYSVGGDGEQDGDETFDASEQVNAAQDWGSSNRKGEFVLKELSTELEDILGDGSASSNNTGSTSKESFGFLKKFIGGKKLSQEDLEKALAAMREHLMQKNVAREVADHLCEIVDKSLVGSKTQNWTSVESTVRTSMTEALRRILTPKTSVDLLHEVQSKRKSAKNGANANAKPYVISVVGVNGVGKSTNLSKIGFWLLQNKFKVLVAACDTFRSGAVEQLKVHVKRLQELTSRLGSGHVEIFDQGYGKDAAVIAQKAIDHGQRNGFDVVLIDTAGRRHNDERLMSSLEKFGKLAQPDKIIMVGEALVGTDSVQQALNFNSAFGATRHLDFFLISKCDTVGDMIGSMVNMTYTTGIPVLFVGIGQNYTDLRTLSVDWAVELLMS